MSSAPAELLGTVGASISLARQLGFALGPALATAVWATTGYTPDGMRIAVGLAAVVSALGVLAPTRSRPTTVQGLAVETAASNH